jgi:hypothetical protein
MKTEEVKFIANKKSTLLADHRVYFEHGYVLGAIEFSNARLDEAVKHFQTTPEELTVTMVVDYLRSLKVIE